MTASLELKKAVTEEYVHWWGEATFIDDESKNAAFDTKDTPLNLSLFKEGTVTLKATNKASSPTLNVTVIAQDHKTGDWRIVGYLPELINNGSATVRITDLTHAMAINATLAGGSFTITITGEFKRGHKQ